MVRVIADVMCVEGRRLSTAIVIKRLAAIVLVVAFFLPLSQCTVEEQNPETRATELKVIVNYAYAHDNWRSLDALATYAAFLWPLTLVIAGLVWPNLNQKLTIGVLELVFCAGSGFVLFALTFIGTLRYGAYLAGVSIGLYFVTTLVELVARARRSWGKQT
jgi:hypothetical protein